MKKVKIVTAILFGAILQLAAQTGFSGGSGIFTMDTKNPDIATVFAKAHIKATDAFGNKAVDGGVGYFELYQPCEDAIANAGNDATICEDQSVYLSGTAENYTTTLWTTDGDGTFDDPASLTTIYNPGVDDQMMGFVELCLTAYAVAPCQDATDCLVITVQSNPVVNAGEDDTVCELLCAPPWGNGNYTLDGSVSNSSNFYWGTSGDGTFSDVSALDAVYTLGDEDIANGAVELCLTAEPVSTHIITVTDCMILSFQPFPVSNAGPDNNICEGGTAQLDGSTENSSVVFWDFALLGEGDGTFNNQLIEDPVYTPGPNDTYRGYVKLLFVAFPLDPCTYPDADDITINIIWQPLVNAGEDLTISGNETAFLDATAEDYSSVLWSTAGDGLFNDEYILNPEYQPGLQDIATGMVELTITVAPIEPCQSHATDNLLLTIGSIGCGLPEGWQFSINLNSHTIAIPLSANPNIFGEPLNAGDWIGVFYMDDEGELQCGGAGQWDGLSNVAVTAYGDDATTQEKDGFASNETINWKIFDCTESVAYFALATYDPSFPNSTGQFVSFGLSGLTSLQTTFLQVISLNEGWNGVSLYLEPLNPALENVFNQLIDDVIIMKSLTGTFWPEYGINTIGDWNANTGYAIKMEATNSLEIFGVPLTSNVISFQPGWHYLPVLSECPASTSTVFDPFADDIVIVKELIGTGVYWPQCGIYTLQELVPGSAYIIKVSSEITITFPGCVGKSNIITSREGLPDNSPWDIVGQTPTTHTVAIQGKAISSLQPGDIVAAFTPSGLCAGMAGYNGNPIALGINGDDAYTETADGFADNETIHYKLYRPAGDETFDLIVEYDPGLDHSGQFHANGLSAITEIKMLATGIEIGVNNNICIYPNPSHGIFNIKGISGTAEVVIFNSFGAKVLNMNINSPGQINLTGQPKGIYFIRLITDDGIYFNKLIVD